MRALILGIICAASVASAAYSADLPVKAPPLPPSSGWTGYYVGANLGYGWGRIGADSTPNDDASIILLTTAIFTGLPENIAARSSNFRVNGMTGGVQAGYNWQLGPGWIAGFETDFNFAGIRGQGGVTSNPLPPASGITQTINSSQSLDWFGTVRGRLGWLATPNLLLFGTGGLAYGRLNQAGDFGYYSAIPGNTVSAAVTFNGIQFFCSTASPPCFAGSSSAIRIGWSAGAGTEWRLSPKVSLKAEYMFVHLADTTLRVQAIGPGITLPSSFSTAFRNDFQIVRAGLNFHF